MPRRLTAVCVALWSLSVIACCFPGDEKTGSKPATQVDAVGDGPAVAVPAQDAGPAPKRVAAPAGEPGKPGATTANSAELVVAAWEAKSPEQVKEIRLPPEAKPEVKRVATTYVAWKRSEWVYGQVKLPDATKYGDLDPDHLNVGESGYLPGNFTTIRIDSDAVVFRTARGKLFAFSGLETSSMVSDRGYSTHSVVECYRTAKFGLYTLPVVRHKSRPTANPFDVEVDHLAGQRRKAAEKELRDARGRLSDARLAAVGKATADASAEAARQIPVPKDGSAQDRIRAKIALERLEQKLQEEARRKAGEEYADPAPEK